MSIATSWFVYILRCADGTFYTGVTTDVERRVQTHNESPTGAKYTKARRPVVLVWSEPAADRSTAQKREAAIKQLSRTEKELLINER